MLEIRSNIINIKSGGKKWTTDMVIKKKKMM